MQNPIQKLRQSSIVFKKSGILSENLKTLTSANYPAVQYFLLKLCTRFLLTNVYKRVWGIHFILIRSWVICKNCFLHTRFLYFYNSRLSKIQVKIIYICFISMYETFKSSRSQGVEAAFCRCFSKYVFFKIPQYSQQNIYVGVRPANLLKSDFNTGVFLWILRNF